MKRSLLIIAVGIGIGYVLGARAGRERYDLIVEKVTGVWEDPRVAKARADAARFAREQAPVVRDRAKALGERAQTGAQALGQRAQSAAKTAASTVTDTAATAAARVGVVRDSLSDDAAE